MLVLIYFTIDLTVCLNLFRYKCEVLSFCFIDFCKKEVNAQMFEVCLCSLAASKPQKFINKLIMHLDMSPFPRHSHVPIIVKINYAFQQTI